MPVLDAAVAEEPGGVAGVDGAGVDGAEVEGAEVDELGTVAAPVGLEAAPPHPAATKTISRERASALCFKNVTSDPFRVGFSGLGPFNPFSCVGSCSVHGNKQLRQPLMRYPHLPIQR